MGIGAVMGTGTGKGTRTGTRIGMDRDKDRDRDRDTDKETNINMDMDPKEIYADGSDTTHKCVPRGSIPHRNLLTGV